MSGSSCGVRRLKGRLTGQIAEDRACAKSEGERKWVRKTCRSNLGVWCLIDRELSIREDKETGRSRKGGCVPSSKHLRGMSGAWKVGFSISGHANCF